MSEPDEVRSLHRLAGLRADDRFLEDIEGG
jgi:hypothetical protein